MKRTAYLLAIILAVTACNVNGPLVIDDEKPSEQIEVVVGISVPSNNPMTKAMDSIPGTGIRNLYAAVFDDAGYLCQYVKAECADGYPYYNSPETDANAKPYKLIFDVSKTKPRIVHFIANGPANVSFGTEESVIASMIAHKVPTGDEIGPDVYWQRVILPEGINFDPSLDEDGNRQLILSSADSLRNVGLVRNFAQFHIKSVASNFELVEAKILMAPDVSYVAPYNKTAGRFIQDYALHSVSELLSVGYIGSAPATARVLADFSNPTRADDEGMISEFMFEREKPTSAPACVIVGGKYNHSSEVTYYKVNLKDTETDDYYPIMRNFNYFVTVNAVGAAGKATMQEAYDTSGSGDISTTFEFSDLASVSNGISQIQVQYTDKVVVNSGSFGLKYKFIPDVNAATETVDNTPHIVSSHADIPADPECGVYIYVDAPDYLGAAISGTPTVSAGDDSSDKTRTITITPVEPSATQKTQSIVLVGVALKDGVKTTIQRKVTITVHNIFNFTATCPAVVPMVKGSTVDLTLTLPTHMRESMFPLQFKIEAEKLSIAPDGSDNLPVETGMSIIDGTQPGYHFIKTITWDEYYHGDGITASDSDYTTSFVCHFKTNTAKSATSIKVMNEYFSDQTCSFVNPTPTYTAGSPVTGSTFRTTAGTMYLIKSNTENTYLTVSGSTVSLTSAATPISESMLFTFSSTGTTASLINVATGKKIGRGEGTSADVILGSDGRDKNIRNYSSGKGYQLIDPSYGSYSARYLYASSSTEVKWRYNNTSGNDTYWQIIPVTVTY